MNYTDGAEAQNTKKEPDGWYKKALKYENLKGPFAYLKAVEEVKAEIIKALPIVDYKKMYVKEIKAFIKNYTPDGKIKQKEETE